MKKTNYPIQTSRSFNSLTLFRVLHNIVNNSNKNVEESKGLTVH